MLHEWSEALLRRCLFIKDLKEVRQLCICLGDKPFRHRVNQVERRGEAVRGKPMQRCLLGPT